MINQDLILYIKNSFINGKLCRFNKTNVKIFVSPVPSYLPKNLQNGYSSVIDKAVKIWNEVSPVKFEKINTPANAEIVIKWTKTGIKYEGMCKFRSIIGSEIRAVTIEVGLPNEKSPKIINEETILHTVLHELGHSMGLGHGVSEDDIMFVPHRKTLSLPSKNDIYVLNFLYSHSVGSSLNEINFI